MDSKDWQQFCSGLNAAQNEIERRVDLINAINLFPVPDNDTGTNMHHTFEAVVDACDADFDDEPTVDAVRELLAEIRERVLGAATGNSGGIFAQFFIGLTSSLERDVRERSGGASRAPPLTPDMIGDAFEAGAREAPDAVAEPVEGTVLSVMSAVADGLRDAPTDRGWEPYLRRGYECGLDALRETRDAPPREMASDVVDAGGLGFVLVTQQLFSVLADESFAFDFSAVELPARIDADELTYPIEVQCLVATSERTDLKRDLVPLGDSVVVTTAGDEASVHVHTDDPDTVVDVAERYGTVSNVERTDMQAQIESLEARLGEARRRMGASEGSGASGTEAVVRVNGRGMVRLFEEMDAKPEAVDETPAASDPSTERRTAAIVHLRIESVEGETATDPKPSAAEVVAVPTMAAALRALVPYDRSRDIEWNLTRMRRALDAITTGCVEYDESGAFSIREGDGSECVEAGVDRLVQRVLSRNRSAKTRRVTWYVGDEAPADAGRRLKQATRERGLSSTVFYGGQKDNELEFCIE